MGDWSKEELSKIANTDDLQVSPFREDGKTYGTPTWIWSVVLGDSLYVRAYNAQRSRWYHAAMQQKAGRIRAGGLTKEVAFESVCQGRGKAAPFQPVLAGAMASVLNSPLAGTR